MLREHDHEITVLGAMTLIVAFLVELAALAALGWWGFATGGAAAAKVALGIGVPLVVAVVWGVFVSPKANVALPGAAQVAIKAAVFGGAALALLALDRAVAAEVFASVVVIDAALLYALGL
jgi:Protein of unknown function (DUF2568)